VIITDHPQIVGKGQPVLAGRCWQSASLKNASA
jgi:hypothetical protein